MKRVGFLGCGKIGKALVKELQKKENVEIAFIQDPVLVSKEGIGCPVVSAPQKALYEKTDLIIECAIASALEENLEIILKNCDLLMFSVTAFSKIEFKEKAEKLCEQYGHHIYIPHGAILGIDGIFDGNKIWNEVTIETRKNPKSLGRNDTVCSVVYEGTTREACKLYPRNVNVHATIAMAGIGFDKTKSKIISDPSVETNEHTISLKGDGIDFKIHISSLAGGAVTGAYTPYSACGSLNRVIGNGEKILFV